MATLNQNVLMLVNNPCTNDSRVIKSAEALKSEGYNVTVVARIKDGVKESETKNGVVYLRCLGIPNNKESILKFFELKTFQILYFRRLSLQFFLVSIFACLGLVFVNCFSFFFRIAKSLRLNLFFKHIKLLIKINKIQSKSNQSEMNTFFRIAKSLRLNLFFKHIKLLIKINKIQSKIIYLRSQIKSKSIYLRSQIKSKSIYLRRQIYQFFAPEEYNEIVYDLAISLKPSLVHCHDLDTLSAGVMIAEASKAKLIYDSHELEMHRNATYSKRVKRRRRMNELRGIRRADAVITVSESIADHLRDDYKIPRPVVVMNSPDFSWQKTNRINLRNAIGLDNSIPLAVYVGGVTINRGLEQMVIALKYYPELHFACVGPRQEKTEIKLREIAISEGVLDRLYMIDPVAPQDVVEFVSKANVSVLPIQNVCLSYYYCMPNKLFESVFAGLPVVVADLKDMRAFVERFKCGVITDETNPKTIANSIHKVFESREKFIVSDKYKNKIYEEFGWHTQSCKLIMLYSNLLTKSAG
jgi:glycosyltransferase involved in cell wall biosynthesis